MMSGLLSQTYRRNGWAGEKRAQWKTTGLVAERNEEEESTLIAQSDCVGQLPVTSFVRPTHA